MMAQKKKTIPDEETLAGEAAGKPKEATARKTSSAARKTAAPKAKTQANRDAGAVEAAPEVKEIPATKEERDRGALLLGAGLLLFGVILLAGRLLSIPLGGFVWPFIFIIPGVVLFWTALTTESSSAEGLVILGGILSMLGLLFLAQSVTGLWASWAYAWVLVAPTSVGLSQMVYGSQKGRDSIYQSGERLVRVGLWMFLVGFVFFELVIGVSGFGLGRFGLPVIPIVLIFAGLVILVRSLARGK
jgi:hypothetical protein